MTTLLPGVLATLIGSAIIFVFSWAWPILADRCLYRGIRVDGAWDITEERNGRNVTVGRLELKQVGARIAGNSCRRKTRDGQKSDRTFSYSGSIYGDQVTLLFEDSKGKGFDTGTYVFIVQNDAKTMVGMTTFHGRQENRIVSEPRILKKAVT